MPTSLEVFCAYPDAHLSKIDYIRDVICFVILDDNWAKNLFNDPNKKSFPIYVSKLSILLSHRLLGNKMKIVGTVTASDQNLLLLELDNEINIFMGLYYAHSKRQMLPPLGAQIEIEKVHFVKNSNSKNYLVCKNGNVKFGEKSNSILPSTSVIRLIKKYKLGLSDLLTIYDVWKRLKFFPQGLDRGEISLLVTNSVLKLTCNMLCEKHQCENSVLPSIQLSSISQWNFVDTHSTNYTGFPYWTWGNHWMKSGEFLIGILTFSKDCGVLILEDALKTMPCLILNASGEEIFKMINNVVLIERCCIITETFQQVGPSNLEYMFVATENIRSLKSLEAEEEKQMAHVLLFSLKSKSSMCIGEDSKVGFWVEIQPLYSSDMELQINRGAFLRLNQKSLCYWHRLQENSLYEIKYDIPLKSTRNVEWQRLNPLNQQYTMNSNCSATINLHVGKSPRNLLEINIDNIKDLLSKEGLVSFIGEIKSKKFSESLKSRTRKYHNSRAFGLPGNKTHLIEFKLDNIKTLCLYLNNWENMPIPLGLIPKCKVAVRNVLIQKKKYCKSSPLTTIEILNYEPQLKYQTVNLFSQGADWGSRFYLGLGRSIPMGLLIWGRIHQIYIRSLRIKTSCIGCGYVPKHSPPCISCGGDLQIDCSLSCVVKDEMGEANVICSSWDVLEILLNIPSRHRSVWKDAFYSLGHFNFKTSDNFKEETAKIFEDCLENYLHVLSSTIVSFDLKCRKLNEHYSDRPNNDNPLWLCIEARQA